MHVPASILAMRMQHGHTETYIILLTNVNPINSIKMQKRKEYSMVCVRGKPSRSSEEGWQKIEVFKGPGKHEIHHISWFKVTHLLFGRVWLKPRMPKPNPVQPSCVYTLSPSNLRGYGRVSPVQITCFKCLSPCHLSPGGQNPSLNVTSRQHLTFIPTVYPANIPT